MQTLLYLQVLNLIFSYVKLLQREGISQSIFEEIQKAADISFQFAEDMSSSDYVETLANDMQFYPPEDYITGSELYFEYDPKVLLNHIIIYFLIKFN